jgi:AcrR family transcriptional regulator
MSRHCCTKLMAAEGSRGGCRSANLCNVKIDHRGFRTASSRPLMKTPAPARDPGPDAERTERTERRYHHGDLAAALLTAGEAELVDRGIEGFSLRGVAKRAGVSHAAPAHHFDDANGLLNAIAARGFERFVARQQDFRRHAAPTARAQMTASGQGYIAFALENPALFRLMFGSDRTDFGCAPLKSAAEAAFDDLARHVAAVTGRASSAPDDPAALADVASAWAMAHGLADLLVAGRLRLLAELPDPVREGVLAAILDRALPAPPQTP